MKLRPYQENAVNAAINYLINGGNAGLISAATGTGKSVIIAEIIRRVLKTNPDARIIVATHVAELLQQNCDKLLKIIPLAPAGIYSAGLGLKEMRQVTFAGIQSIFRKKIPKTNLLIVDEAHTISRKSISMWATLINGLKEDNHNLKIIGLSATIFRMDSGSLTSGDDALFKDIIFEYGLGKAIQDGYLCELVPKKTKTEYDLSGVGTSMGEFNQKELESATNLDHLNKSAVKEIVEWGRERRSWLVFCNGVAHSFAVRDEIRSHGITCETVTGDTPEDERGRILKEFKEGKIKSVTNNAVWTTGVDAPEVDLIAMMRMTMSGGLLLQMAGRGTRTVIDLNGYADSKERRQAIKQSMKPNCLFLDFAGNIQRHGMLDMIKGKDKKASVDGVAPMKFCPECATICYAAATYCKDCGCVFPVLEKENISAKAYSGAVMSSQVEAEVKEVLGVEYIPSRSKKGDGKYLLVKYKHPGVDVTRSYMIPYGRGKQAFDEWYKFHAGTDYPHPFDVFMAQDRGFFSGLKIPTYITVVERDGFDKVIDYDFSPKPNMPIDVSMTLADMDDISF